MIRVASYNIHKAIGIDRRRNPERILDVLNEIDADVIALQEADRRFGLRSSAIPAKLLTEHSDYVPIRFHDRENSMGWHGNALLIRNSLSANLAKMIDIPSLEPRGAVMAQVETRLGALCVVGMHLDLSGLRRRQQIRAILADAKKHLGMLPLIIMGDCNEWSPHGGSMTEFAGHTIAHTGASFHSRRPIARLDRIIACKRLHISAAGTHHSLKARYASDHLPVWAEIARV